MSEERDAAPLDMGRVTDEMLRRIEIFKRLFVYVPLNECEKEPDPDYGL